VLRPCDGWLQPRHGHPAKRAKYVASSALPVSWPATFLPADSPVLIILPVRTHLSNTPEPPAVQPPLTLGAPPLQVTKFLVDDAEVGEWVLQGLPTDELSVQNGIMVTRASRCARCKTSDHAAARAGGELASTHTAHPLDFRRLHNLSGCQCPLPSCAHLLVSTLLGPQPLLTHALRSLTHPPHLETPHPQVPCSGGPPGPGPPVGAEQGGGQPAQGGGRGGRERSALKKTCS
jgi:hypothetical protein